MRQDDAVEGSQKIGVKNAPGWAAYSLNGELFMKRFPLDADKEYPDFGCNFEAYTAKGMLEIESLGPLVALAANGGTACHTERWFLFKCQPGETDDAINADVLPLIEESGAIIARQIMAEPQDISEDLAREHSLRMWGVMRNAKQR